MTAPTAPASETFTKSQTNTRPRFSKDDIRRVVSGARRSPLLSEPFPFEVLSGLGILVCVVGSIVAVLFIPCKVLGTHAGWHFIFSEAGFGARSYELIDPATLLLELILINGIGIAMFFAGRKKT